MEGYYIPILESFPIISVVMPYFGYTHKMFLVLSVISKRTRLVLINNYTQFRRYMRQYCLVKDVSIKTLSTTHLPCDLFAFNIKEDSLSKGVNDLLSFANTVI